MRERGVSSKVVLSSSAARVTPAGPAFATKGGIGSASALLPSGHTLGALVAVNAVGDIYDPDAGRIVAGARAPDGHGWLAQYSPPVAPYHGQAPGTNTTLAVIANDAQWGKEVRIWIEL